MKKENLIILPGWGGSHETWRDFVNFIKNDFENVNVIDLPCFGTAPCPDSVWGVEEYTKYAKKEIDKLNYADFVLLGHSFGGQVAVNYAVEYPEKINKLILSCAAVFRPKYTFRRVAFGFIAKTGKTIFKLPIIEKFDVFAKKMLYRAVGSHDYENSAGIKRDIFKKTIRQDFRHQLPKIKAPTLVVWGRKDTYVPVRYGKKIHTLIPNAQLQIIEKGGHGLHIHNKNELKKHILDFLYHDQQY